MKSKPNFIYQLKPAATYWREREAMKITKICVCDSVGEQAFCLRVRKEHQSSGADILIVAINESLSADPPEAVLTICRDQNRQRIYADR